MAIRSGPQSGQIGYLTPAVSGSPTAAERGTKSEVAHKVGKLATSPLPYRGAPPLQSGGLNQKWPTKWARWLHNLFCAFQPFLNSPQNSEYFEYRHIGWNKKNSPCRMPKTKSPAPPAPTKHLVPCDNFGVRRGGGVSPPPFWGRVLTRSAPRALMHVPRSRHTSCMYQSPDISHACTDAPPYLMHIPKAHHTSCMYQSPAIPHACTEAPPYLVYVPKPRHTSCMYQSPAIPHACTEAPPYLMHVPKPRHISCMYRCPAIPHAYTKAPPYLMHVPKPRHTSCMYESPAIPHAYTKSPPYLMHVPKPRHTSCMYRSLAIPHACTEAPP